MQTIMHLLTAAYDAVDGSSTGMKAATVLA
jgi:hypothetical protein